MEALFIFGLQFTLSFLVYALIAWWYVAPRLSSLPLAAGLTPLLLVQSFRHIGLTILTPGATDPGVPKEFAQMVAYGDLASVVLALVALVALRARVGAAVALVWLFNVVGSLDLINATVEGIRFQVFNHSLGATWLIVTFYVPALWVSSIMIFVRLLKPRSRVPA